MAQLFEKTLRVDEKRRLGFLTLTVSPDNMASHIVNKFGIKELVFLKKSRQKLMVTSTTRMGRLACAFFRMIGLLLPNTFLSYVHLWLYRKTLV